MTDRSDGTEDLEAMLTHRRRELQIEVLSRIRDGRADRATGVHDLLDISEAETQGDLELALLQLRSETLSRIDEALVRLDAGQYGRCFECAGPIAERRLRALPFAVRCQACEERREQTGHARQLDQRRAHLALFSTAVRP